MKVKKLEWSEIQQPNKNCSYHHVTAKINGHEFRITWKGWKEYPCYDIESDFLDELMSEFYGHNTLEAAKEEAQRVLDEFVIGFLETKNV